MTKKWAIAFLLFSVNIVAIAQSKPNWPSNSFAVGYYGNLITNPGLTARFESKIYENVKTKSRPKRGHTTIKYKTNRFELAPELGFFYDPKTATNAFSFLNFQYKRVNHHHWLFSPSVGLGGTLSFVPNVYDANQNYAFRRISNESYWAAKTALEFGKLKTNNDRMAGLYVSVSSQFLFNYNGGTLPLPAIEIGKRF